MFKYMRGCSPKLYITKLLNYYIKIIIYNYYIRNVDIHSYVFVTRQQNKMHVYM